MLVQQSFQLENSLPVPTNDLNIFFGYGLEPLIHSTSHVAGFYAFGLKVMNSFDKTL